jgi:hypothetical protein
VVEICAGYEQEIVGPHGPDCRHFFLGRVGRFNGAWIVVVVCFGDLGRCASAGRWGRVKLLCFEDGGDGWVHMYCFEVARLYYSVLQRVRLIL